VKKWIAYLLFLYILLCAVVPCSLLDECEAQDNVPQTSQSTSKKDCNGCSPFSVCAEACGFTMDTENISIAPIALYQSSSYCDYCFTLKSTHFFAHFQPPRFIWS